MSNYSNLTAQQLRKAADLKEKIVGLQQQLEAILGGSAPAATGEKRKRRKMSAAARAKIAAAQRARWAKVKAKK